MQSARMELRDAPSQPSSSPFIISTGVWENRSPPSRQRQWLADSKEADADDDRKSRSHSHYAAAQVQPAALHTSPASAVAPAASAPAVSVSVSPPPSPSRSLPSSPSLSPSHRSPRRWYQVGDSRMRWGDQLRPMVDSAALLSSPDLLRAALRRDGYILLRGVVPRSLIAPARQVVTAALHKQWNCIDTSKQPHTAAAIPPAAAASRARSPSSHPSPSVLLTGYAPVTHHPAVLSLLQSPSLCSLFALLFAARPATFNTKWVRVMGRGEYTEEHVDYYRFRSNARGLHTCWLPLGDYSKEQGVLAVCTASHRIIEREEEAAAAGGGQEQQQAVDAEESKCSAMQGGEEEKSELPAGYTARASELHWHTADVSAGDVVIFDIRTVHASTANEEGSVYRISMDTRWQPAHLTPPEHRGAFTAF